MKFMALYKLHPNKRHDALRMFSQMTADDDKAEVGDKIKLIGRWHDVPNARGVAIIESDNLEAISDWALNWNQILDIDFSPVLDDTETKILGKKRNF